METDKEFLLEKVRFLEKQLESKDSIIDKLIIVLGGKSNTPTILIPTYNDEDYMSKKYPPISLNVPVAILI